LAAIVCLFCPGFHQPVTRVREEDTSGRLKSEYEAGNDHEPLERAGNGRQTELHTIVGHRRRVFGGAEAERPPRIHNVF
jgi:hypothetical protein